jgi:hypothetical protein
MEDTKKQAIECFKKWYNTKRAPFSAFAAIPDPEITYVWLVIGKHETARKVELLAAIIYIKRDDCEEVSALEAMTRHPIGLMEALQWVENTKKKVVDLTLIN